jgi:hypothetical protein
MQIFCILPCLITSTQHKPIHNKNPHLVIRIKKTTQSGDQFDGEYSYSDSNSSLQIDPKTRYGLEPKLADFFPQNNQSQSPTDPAYACAQSVEKPKRRWF